MNKTLSEMADEVYEVNAANGWYEDERTFGDDIALLHSEVSEAFEAYRSWGFEDHDVVLQHVVRQRGVTAESDEILRRIFRADEPETIPRDEPLSSVRLSPDDKLLMAREGIMKPEGVGSELADILIRLLDTAKRRGWDFEQAFKVRDYEPSFATWGTVIAEMHYLIATGIPRHRQQPQEIATLYSALLVAARLAGVDLEWEYERKLAFNKTRGHKHGGKLL